MPVLKGLIILPRLKIQNVNCVVGNLLWGFPSPTAFAGFAHALERYFEDDLDEGFAGIGIICHAFTPQVFQPAGKRTQVFCLTRNPVGKDGKPPGFVEQGRAHMEVSLILGVKDYKSERKGQSFAERVMAKALGSRLAGGSVLPQRDGPRYLPRWYTYPEDQHSQEQQFRTVRRHLLPGYALVHRPDYLHARLEQLQAKNHDASRLDVLLDVAGIHIQPDHSDLDEDAHWSVEASPGWLVPMAIGYAAITERHCAGTVNNARDNTYPFCFVENLYSIGQWLSPHRIDSVQAVLWDYDRHLEHGVYQCRNHYTAFLPSQLETV